VNSVDRFDDAVVGAGILGLAHAYHLARRGRRVIVFERHSRACGASVRNFGMIWPIGQPFGDLRDLARRSLAIWLEVLSESGLWHDRCGSLHLAYRDDEAQVLREFVRECLDHDVPVELLDPAELHRRAPAVRQAGLQLGLWSPEETCVDPREVLADLPGWLSQRLGVVFRYESPIVALDSLPVHVDRVWVCSGDESNLLFPELLKNCGLLRCKLQMMRSQPLDEGMRIGPMLAAGLTLRHYAAFRNCPSLATLKERVARESPWLDQYGIHVLVSQHAGGELTIGDSHEYGDRIEPFDKAEIEGWILGYLSTFLHAPDLRIAARWHGTYVKHQNEPFVIREPRPGVTVITGVGGAGMTLSFGLAERVVVDVLGASTS
jgi:FAD dependent oxidoreductase TIGR03364